MAQIQWQTRGGDLGTYAEQSEIDKTLQAVDPAGNPLTFLVISGALPTGISLYQDSGRLYGYPLINDSLGDLTLARRYTFTVRAQNSLGELADRTFSISVNNLEPPQIISPEPENLGQVFDSDFVNIQFRAADISPQNISEWTLAEGRLPLGLTLSPDGRLSGFALAPPETGPEGTGTYDVTLYDEFTWDFGGRSPTITYKFTIRYYDGRTYDTKVYTFTVISKRFFTVDNTFITADNTIFSVDVDGNYYPSMLTTPDELLPVRQDRYFSFRFRAYFFNPTESIKFAITAGGPAKFDQDNPTIVEFDRRGFDQANLTLPPGLTFDGDTGWLYGQLPQLSTSDLTYTFQVSAYPTTFPDRLSTPVTYTLRILNDIDNEIAWITETDLGGIDNGRVSTLEVQALSLNNKDLTYTLTAGELPNGLTLLPSGRIAGRTSFQFFDFNDGTSVDTQTTTFDDTYTFTVTATATDSSATASKQFTVRIDNINQEPFENLYIKAFLPDYLRRLFDATVTDPRVITEDLLYRPDDPWFGRATDIRFLAIPGIRASKLSEYALSIQNYHRNKPITLSDLKYAVALDENFNVKYEVVYVEVLDYNNRNQPGGAVTRLTKNAFPASDDYEFINQTAVTQEDVGLIDDSVENFEDYGSITGALTPGDSVSTIYPNSFANMTQEVATNLGYEFQGALPEWMTSVQPLTGRVLGFVRGIVLAYAKPGAGAEMFFRVSQSLLGRGYSTLNLINQFRFTIDRYQLDNYLSRYYDTDNQRFIPATNPSFNQINSIGLYNRGAWIEQDTNTTATLNDVHTESGLTVAVGTRGNIITSRDGSTWNQVQSTVDFTYESGLPFVANASSTFIKLADDPRLSAGSFLLNSNVADPNNYYITKTVSNAVSRATKIDTVQKEILLSGALTSTVTSGTTLTFTSFTGINVNVTVSTTATSGSTTLLVDNTDQLDLGFGLATPVANVGTFVQAKYANISISSTGRVAGVVSLGNLVEPNLPIGIVLTFKDVITANAAAGTSVLTFSSTEKIGTGSFVSGSAVYNNTTVLSKTDTTVTLSLPLKNSVAAEQYGPSGLTFTLGQFNFNSVHYADGKWLIAGDSGLILTSETAETWDIQTTNQVLNLRGAFYGGGRWTVIGNEGLILTSTDAEIWTPVPLGLSVDLNSISYGGGRWIIVGQGGIILTSTNGISWSINNSVTTRDLNAVHYGGIWVAVGQRGIILRSENGVDWVNITTSNRSTLNGVHYATVWTAVGNTGTVLTSTDAFDWLPVDSGTTEILNTVNSIRGIVTTAGRNGTIINESDFFIVNIGVRGVSFQDFNHASVERLRTLGYSVKDGDTVIWVQQEGYLNVREANEPYENNGWNLLTRFGDTAIGDDYDETPFNQSRVIPGFQENALDPTVPNQRAGIWQVAIENNAVVLTFLRQIKLDQTVYVQQDRQKYFYDSSIKLGKTVPEYSPSSQQQLDPVTQVVTAPQNVDVYAPPQTDDKYIKFPN
jgi:hypothetical protein